MKMVMKLNEKKNIIHFDFEFRIIADPSFIVLLRIEHLQDDLKITPLNEACTAFRNHVLFEFQSTSSKNHAKMMAPYAKMVQRHRKNFDTLLEQLQK